MAARSQPKVFVVLLNVNSYADTSACLESLRKVEYSNFRVIVIDNGSTDDSFARLQSNFPEATVRQSKVNLGFTGGNNVGITAALKEAADYVLLLNNDTLVDPRFVSELVGVGESNPANGILGPKILYASEPQRIWYAGGRIRYANCLHVGVNELDGSGRYSLTQETDFISGCAMLVKAAVFRRVGLLDDKLFVYHEDTDFCMRARKAGYTCVFVPTSRIWHKISRTCGPQSPFTLYLLTRNQLRWVWNHVPFPYKVVALVFTVAKKLAKMAFLSTKDRNAAAAILAGMSAFFRNRSGPPRTGMLPASQTGRIV